MPITAGQWDEICAVIDRPDLVVDERYASPHDRLERRDEVYEIFAAWTRERTKVEAMEAMAEAGVPCSAVLDTAELHTDRHLVARGFVHHMDLPMHGEVPLLGFAPRLSKSDVAMAAPPMLGEHTREVLAADLGLDADELDSLSDQGAIG